MASDFTLNEKGRRASIGQQEEAMEQLVAEATHGRALPNELCGRRASIPHSHDVEKGLLAPITKLAPETLGNIFLHCFSTPDKSISFQEAPLLMMLVSRGWRQVAKSTPGLWKELNLTERLVLDPCSIIPTWLSNSGVLTISIVIFPEYWPERWNKLEAAQLVVQNFSRFHRFEGSLDASLHGALSRINHPIDAPLLECFTLTHPINSEEPTPDPHLPACIRAPKLTTIIVDNSLMMDIISFDPSSLHSFTLLHDFSADPVSSLQFLTACHYISSLDLNLCDGMQPPIISGHSRIFLPCLVKLRIDPGLEDDPCPFLDSLEVPKLQELIIEYTDALEAQDIPELIPALESLLGRGTHLQRLTLSHMDTTIDFASLLPNLHYLITLSLTCCTVYDSTLEILTPDPSSPPSSWICPQLSTLDITQAELDPDLLVELVRCRAPRKADVALVDASYLHNVNLGCLLTSENDIYVEALEEIVRLSQGLLKIICRKQDSEARLGTDQRLGHD